MTTIDQDALDANVPELAVQALTEANRRAVAAGHPIGLVRGSQLIRCEGDQEIVLKEILGRKKVAFRVKRREK